MVLEVSRPGGRAAASLALAGLAAAPISLFAAQALAPQKVAAQGAAPQSILLVSYAVTKAAYDRIIPQFEADWKKKTGQIVDVKTSYGGSGSQTRAVLDGLEADDFQRIYAVNVVGAFQMARAFAPLLKRHPPGAVVNISSIAAATGLGSSMAYAASKGALNTLTMSLARALGPVIRVNAIAPGLVESPWLQNGMGAERYAAGVVAYKARAALAEIIQPEDVARAAWFLGVDAVKTTGEVLPVDAGAKLISN